MGAYGFARKVRRGGAVRAGLAINYARGRLQFNFIEFLYVVTRNIPDERYKDFNLIIGLPSFNMDLVKFVGCSGSIDPDRQLPGILGIQF
jgi:hypothetical protein